MLLQQILRGLHLLHGHALVNERKIKFVWIRLRLAFNLRLIAFVLFIFYRLHFLEGFGLEEFFIHLI